VWYGSVGDITRLLDDTAPAGQKFYLMSKWFALVAIFALALQLLMMLATYVLKPGDRRHVMSLHRVNGFLLLTSVVGHIASFFAATSIRAGHLNYKLFIPTFFNDYYTAMTSIGLLAAVAMVALIWFGMRGYGKSADRSSLHKTLFPVFTTLAVVHSFTIGSEAKNPPVLAVYVVALATCVILVWMRWTRRH